jgi:hypothetical protein
MKATAGVGVGVGACTGAFVPYDNNPHPRIERIPMFTDAQRFCFLRTFARSHHRYPDETAVWSVDIPSYALPRGVSLREAIDQALLVLPLPVRYRLLQEVMPDLTLDPRQGDLFSPSSTQEDPCP